MPSNANLKARFWCALILGMLALLALAARSANAQSVRLELTNITRDAAFDGLVAWSGPARDRYPAARHDGRPAKELADLSRSLPAAPLAALLNAQPGVTAVHREGMIQPGETVYVTVPARHGGWRVALPLAGEDGYAWCEGEVSPETPSQNGLAHAFDAGSVAWVTIHSARRAPVARWRSEWRRSRPASRRTSRPPGGSGGGGPEDPERVPDPPPDDLDPPSLPDASAGTLSIDNPITSLAAGQTHDFDASSSGGIWDSGIYAWSVLSGGGAISGAGVYAPSNVQADTTVRIRVTGAFYGSGGRAKSGTRATASADTAFTVLAPYAPPRNMTCKLHDIFPDPTACAALTAYRAGGRAASWRPGGKYHPVSGWACRGTPGPRRTSYTFYHDGRTYRVRLEFDCP